MGRKILVTRPRIASKLIEAGFEGQKIRNPYNPGYVAWEFDSNDEVLKIVSNYYSSIEGNNDLNEKR